MFSNGEKVRLFDLRDLPTAPLDGQALVFINACQGASQDAFYYDGFMPFFINQLGARGLIGTEVDAPQRLAHHVGMRFLQEFGSGKPIGEIFWHLRRAFLAEHQNMLAFNYSLYSLSEVHLARSLDTKLT
jgi:hypothetical protein